jgi:S-adenosylmethionine:tRNA ribosyltransferase-isomerase
VTALTDPPNPTSIGLDFALGPRNEAQEPAEARGTARDAVRLLVSDGDAPPVDSRFDRIGEFLQAGDLLVVNTSATVAAALDGRLPDGEPAIVHLSGALPGGVWLVEVRRPHDGSTAAWALEEAVEVALVEGGRVRLLTPFEHSQRLWIAALDLPAEDPLAYLAWHGRPIRYRHVPREWPLSAYQTVFGTEPGSAEMPSASRPFTPQLVTELVTRGVGIAPLVLHTGVSSLEGGERPYPERYRVVETTATAIDDTRRNGGRVIAAGTTVVRALATVTDRHGQVHPGQGWTDVVVTGGTELRSVDGLLTGWHEPESTHLWMLQAFATPCVLEAAYRRALELGYLWHEFGDTHLIMRSPRSVTP